MLLSLDIYSSAAFSCEVMIRCSVKWVGSWPFSCTIPVEYRWLSCMHEAWSPHAPFKATLHDIITGLGRESAAYMGNKSSVMHKREEIPRFDTGESVRLIVTSRQHETFLRTHIHTQKIDWLHEYTKSQAWANGIHARDETYRSHIYKNYLFFFHMPSFMWRKVFLDTAMVFCSNCIGTKCFTDELCCICVYWKPPVKC